MNENDQQRLASRTQVTSDAQIHRRLFALVILLMIGGVGWLGLAAHEAAADICVLDSEWNTELVSVEQIAGLPGDLSAENERWRDTMVLDGMYQMNNHDIEPGSDEEALMLQPLTGLEGFSMLTMVGW